MPEMNKLRVAFLWHMHQPFYLDPDNRKFMMPWARLHGLKDYLDMPLLAARHNIKATFNLVPSLLDQIELYGRGYTDRHLELSRIPARELSLENRKDILTGFFVAHYPTMIEPNPRYNQLFRKQESCGADLNLAVDIFSTSEWRDLQVWSNLTWIDPMFREDEPVKELLRKGRDFSEEEKASLLDYEIELLRKIIPTYQQLFREKKIDISFTPYYHPILPLLIDSNVAREAIADIKLPRHRFNHPEDACWHIDSAVKKFRELFGEEIRGMWPSEGSISEDTLKLLATSGIKWVATDEEILYHSLIKSGQDTRKFSPHFCHIYDKAPQVRLFFRDHGLSDKIGFVYSGWEADRAVGDFIQTLKNIGKTLGHDSKNSIISVILDGENAWEYFPNDGTEFLSRLYQAVADDEQIEAVFLSEAADMLEPRQIPSLTAGSWINHNFRIWIGHSEDNQAWDLLSEARKTLTDFQQNNPQFSAQKLAAAWQQLHIAEGSDWCWWYGDDHLGNNNEQFDILYRAHLSAVYKILNLKPPAMLLKPIHRGKLKSFVSLPESIITPTLDGYLTHYYEWSGAGQYDCLKANTAMHRVDIYITSIYFAFDHENFYIRVDFDEDFDLVKSGDWKVVLDFKHVGAREIPLEKAREKSIADFVFSFNRILEVRFDRRTLAAGGSGKVEFFVILCSGKEIIEKWPFDEPISLELAERDKELFWQV